MVSESRKYDIELLVKSIDSFSERYQLSHAIVAIERLYKDRVQEEFRLKYAKLREQIKEAEDIETQSVLANRVAELKKESHKRIRISIEYSEKMLPNSSRIAKTPNDIFIITLPKCMTTIRNEDDVINIERLNKLRKLMAHELGHIVLHQGLFGFGDLQSTLNSPECEAEADYFADRLLDLRRTNMVEMAECVNEN